MAGFEPFWMYTPFQNYVVTSRFGEPRNYKKIAPHRLQLHEGEDSVDGTNPQAGLVYCGRDGTVTNVDYNATGYGNYCVVSFGNGWSAYYAHLKTVTVKVGQKVSARQSLGQAGESGNANGVHCHLTLCNNKIGLDNYVVRKVVDPSPYLRIW